jgi:hypothetical protein
MSATWTRYEASALSVQGMSNYQNSTSVRIRTVFPSFWKINFSAGKLYNNLTEAHNTLKGVIDKYNIEFTRHHKINSYVSSKVIMENSSHTFYLNHTICIVRPSRDGTQWGWHTWLWHMIRSTACQIDTSSHHERTILQGQAEFGLCW